MPAGGPVGALGAEGRGRLPGQERHDRLLRATRRGGRDDVFVINPDGSGLRNLTNPSGRTETEPSFSADGEKIVYVRKPSDSQNREIVTVNFPGGSQRTTVARSYAYFPEPAFSPDGEKIVFVKRSSDPTSDTEIYTVDVDGGGLSRLTDDATQEGSPSFSPDGTEIAFSRSGSGGTRVWTMNADGSGKKNLSGPYGEGADVDPDWSPDGTGIAFTRQRDGEGTDIYAIRPGGTGLRNITKNPNVFEGEPAYSPNGQRIAFARYEEGFGGYNIWAARAADGSNQVPVTDDTPENPSAPSWGPLP